MAWPAVAAVGRSELRRLRLPSETVEDLLQEAAAVVMRRRPPFSDSDDLAPYVRVVVRRLAYRWLRRQSREVVGEVPDVQVVHSVPEVAEQRLRLRGTAQAFASLSSVEQGRLRHYLAAETREGDARERARERKQIERIRMAMSKVADGFAAALGWIRMRCRWFEPMTPHAASAALALTGLVAVLLPAMPGTTPASPTHVVSAGAGTPVAFVSDVRSAGGSAMVSPPVSGPASGSRRPATHPPTSARNTETTEVVRITSPTGKDTSWTRGPNPTGDALVCVGPGMTGFTCLDQPVTVPKL